MFVDVLRARSGCWFHFCQTSYHMPRLECPSVSGETTNPKRQTPKTLKVATLKPDEVALRLRGDSRGEVFSAEAGTPAYVGLKV